MTKNIVMLFIASFFLNIMCSIMLSSIVPGYSANNKYLSNECMVPLLGAKRGI